MSDGRQSTEALIRRLSYVAKALDREARMPHYQPTPSQQRHRADLCRRVQARLQRYADSCGDQEDGAPRGVLVVERCELCGRTKR